MKIIDRATFLSMPEGTVYAKYVPMLFGDLMIKGETIPGDFYFQQIVDAIDSESSNDWADKLIDSQENGTSLAMDFHCEGRDGFYDEDQLFAVFEPRDVRSLIERLQEALTDANPEGHRD